MTGKPHKLTWSMFFGPNSEKQERAQEIKQINESGFAKKQRRTADLQRAQKNSDKNKRTRKVR